MTSTFLPPRLPPMVPLRRRAGRLDFDLTTLGLGGQGALQWSLDGEDPVKIILKARSLGVNFFDTSNLYGPSQSSYGRAFRELGLVPGVPGYREELRRAVFLSSKTSLRFARGGWWREYLRNETNGPRFSTAVLDLRRTLSQVFGDGRGWYPRGSYVDLFLVHAVGSFADVDASYEGYDHSDPRDDCVGVLAALRDFRDGTNVTGCNPREERLVRHVGFSGHASPEVMLEVIRRDHLGLLDAVVLPVNANDRLYASMQDSVVPAAASRGMGVVGMKVFAGGALCGGKAAWTSGPGDVVRGVCGGLLPSRRLVEYSLTTPGVHAVLVGVGHVDDDPASCQLTQNFEAAQLRCGELDDSSRREVEELAAAVQGGRTNYFQDGR